jgi:hypothetical protein
MHRFSKVHCILLLGLGGVAACGDGGTGPDDDSTLSELDADVAPVVNGAWYRPAADVRWQWQLDGPINTTYDVEMFDVDLFETPADVIAALHSRGIRVLCYFSAGTHENGRPDAAAIPASAIGAQLEDWPNERWLDIRKAAVFAVMVGRLDLARSRGCDGVEPDNVDGFINATGFALTSTDQLAFNRNLANAAHERGLTVALKNDGDQAAQLVAYYDLELNEECFYYDECDQLGPFLTAGKPVLNVEYANDAAAAGQMRGTVCSAATVRGLRTLILPWDLDDSFREACF